MSERSNTYRTRAVILRRRNFSDADRILTVITPTHGKRLLMAKGVRKTASRKAGHLELFSHTSLLAAKARTWDIVTESETVESFLRLRANLDRISQAAYICELVDTFASEDDENRLLWELLLLCLRELDSEIGDQEMGDHEMGDQDSGALLVRWFELHLLSLMGFQPQIFSCLGCEDDLLPVKNYLHIPAGGVYCPRCSRNVQDAEPIAPEVLKVLRHLTRTHWSELRTLTLRNSTLGALESILQRYLVHIMERRLKSADFLHQVRHVS